MGQEESHMVDEATPPETLKARTAEAVANYIATGRVRRIVVMTGAGLSTSAGIPDFRSPDTGLYANLQRLDLPFAEAVFDINYFRQNPLPFYTLAHELYPGRYRPTIAHSFIRLLHDKGLLLKLFTQNIDCLEREAGVPDNLIVEAHGSFARQRCIECRTEYPDDRMQEVVQNKEVPYCLVEGCHGLVKPDIVFFGESLPEAFFRNRHLPGLADLCIVMGTSLTVQPFASLPQFAAEGVPRVLINKERVGGLGSRADDVLMLGDCDDGVRKLADYLGWRDELETLWAGTVPKGTEELGRNAKESEKDKSKDELLDDEIQKLTKEVDESLKISKEHTDWVNKGLGESGEKAAKPRTEAAVAAGDVEAQMEPHEKQKDTIETILPDTIKGQALEGEKQPLSADPGTKSSGKDVTQQLEEKPKALGSDEDWETDSSSSANNPDTTKDTKRNEKPSL